MDNKKRTCIQFISCLIQNANFKGFFTGKIYQGQTKNVCVPGLNCYSCPGAMGSCPIGSLQNALSSYRFKFPYYVLGLLIFFGIILGRIICGFLCPFGLLQDILYKIPGLKKIRGFKGDRILRKIKYIVLIVMVIILPIAVKLTPFFCKYLCPSGTVAGILLSLTNSELFSVLGSVFMLKVSILGLIILLAWLISRPFCKYLCPLGAFYGMLNKVSIINMNVDEDKCTKCGACKKNCIMDIDPSKELQSAECIRCGRCAHACPENAIKYCNLFAKDK